ncbi:MAG: helix-turn-helix domain-containing protein [Cytophagales bacterium]|nr:MAG: helix-turn-helix domain-containing protein [Cytophagales bacterium]
MQELIFNKNKYGKEILIDTIYTTEFALEEGNVLPNFYTVVYLKKSQGSIKINHQEITLKDNIILFIPASQNVDVVRSIFEEGIFIFFEGEFLDKFFNEANFIFKFSFFHNTDQPLHLIVEDSQKENIYYLFEQIHFEIKNFRNDSEHLIRAYLYQLLIKTNRLYTYFYPKFNAHLLTNEILLRFRYELEKKIKQHSDVQYYADSLNISRVYLNKLCINFYSKTCIQVIRERLALEAKKELLYSSKTIAEIAYELHFSDPPNFNRFFKQMTSYTPKKFRELSN